METQRYDPDLFHPGSQYYNPMDDDPPRCRSCGSEDIGFIIVRGTRYFTCNQCGRHSANPARYDPEMAVSPPRGCTPRIFVCLVLLLLLTAIGYIVYRFFL